MESPAAKKGVAIGKVRSANGMEIAKEMVSAPSVTNVVNAKAAAARDAVSDHPALVALVVVSKRCGEVRRQR